MTSLLVAQYHHNFAQLFRIEQTREYGRKTDERPTPFRALGAFSQTKEILMITRTNSWRQLAAISALALLAACGSSHNQQSQQQAQANTSAFMHSPTSAGTVLTTANGMTLYTYDKDTVGQSACYGDCAQYWHPYLSNGTSMPSGKMTLVTRSDGSQQWAYDGKPLYTFTQDTSAGQVNGNNFHNNWHVIAST